MTRSGSAAASSPTTARGPPGPAELELVGCEPHHLEELDGAEGTVQGAEDRIDGDGGGGDGGRVAEADRAPKIDVMADGERMSAGDDVGGEVGQQVDRPGRVVIVRSGPGAR